MKKTAFFILMILVLSGCAEKSPSIISPTLSPTTDPCPVEQIEQFIAAADDAMYRFTQLAQQADATPAEDLESTIKEMQVIEAEAKEIDPPSCALEAESALTSYMWTKIQGYFRLFVQELELGITPEVYTNNKPTADDEFTLAASKLEYYETKMEELRNLLLEKSKSE
ncbi:MAG: hypothetical protein K8R16_07235 [Anaerolineales bacterium]|nr:hypothetical protein [Anaerolineales bacterium]